MKRRARLGQALGFSFFAALSGCSFSFDNPIELQPNNSISGAVAIADPRCGSSPAGVKVTVLWTSGFNAHPAADGKFLLLGLPDGVYTLRYDYFDPDAGSDAGPVCSGLLPNIQLPRLLNQQSDALDLGTFSLSPLVTVRGVVDAGAAVVVGAFTPDQPGAPGIFESYWTQSDGHGAFALTVPVGHHVVWVSSSTTSAPLDLTLDGGGNVDLGLVTLSAPDSGLTIGDLTGNIVLSLPGFGAGADAGAIAALFGVGESNFEINPPQPFPFSLTSQVGGVGAEMSQPLPPGGFQNVFCGLKDETRLSVAFNDLELPNIPSFVGRATTLGQITWISNAQFLDAGETPPEGFPDNGTDGGALDAGRDGGSSDAGPDGGVDAGAEDGGLDAGAQVSPPHWHTVGSVVLPAYDPELTTFVLADLDGGAALFYTNDGTNPLYLSVASDGGFGALNEIDPNCQWVYQAITDSRGAPLALGAAFQSSVLLAPLADGGFGEVPVVNDAGESLELEEGQGAIVEAPPKVKPLRTGATAYYLFPDPALVAIDLAAFVPPASAQIVATYVMPDGGGVAEVSNVTAGPCDLRFDPGLCVLLSTSNQVFAMSVDLQTGVATPPFVVSGYASYVPQMFVVPLADGGGLFAGWIEDGDGPPNVPYWIANASGATFACDPLSQSCQPPEFSAAGLQSGVLNDVLLPLHGDALLVFTAYDAGGAYNADAVDLTTLESLNLPNLQYLSGPSGFVDSRGRPVVGVAVDAGGPAAIDIFTYY